MPSERTRTRLLPAPRAGASPPRGRRGRRSGFTLLEAIGFLTVAVIIIAGTLGVYDQAKTAVRTNQIVVAVAVLTSAVYALHANTGHFGPAPDATADADLSEVLVAAGFVPQGLTVPAPGTFEYETFLGGVLRIYAGALGGNNGFWVEVDGLADDVCINLVTKMVAGTYHGLRTLRINTTDFSRGRGQVAPPAGVQTFPVTPVEATDACDRGTTGVGGNTFRMTFV